MADAITLTMSAYKRLRHMRNTIQAITDATGQGADISQQLLTNLLVELGEEVAMALEQIERDIEVHNIEREHNDTITNRSSDGRNVNTT